MHGWAMYLDIELRYFMHKTGSSFYTETKIAIMFTVQ